MKQVNITHLFFKGKDLSKRPLWYQKKWFGREDTIMVKFLWFNPIILTRSPMVCTEVLQTQGKMFEKTNISTQDLAQFTGRGLIIRQGEDWKKQRRLMQPSFHKNYLKSIIPKMELGVRNHIDHCNISLPVNLYQHMVALTINVMTHSLFSIENKKDSIILFQQKLDNIQRFVVRYVWQPHLRWYFKVSGLLSTHLKLSQSARAIIEQIIDDSDNINLDLLHSLKYSQYEDGKRMNKRDLIDEVFGLFIAGTETTAVVLSNLFLLLSKHPLVYKKVITEIEENSTLDSYPSNFIYLTAVINETMRLYPSVWLMDRKAKTNVTIQGNKIFKDQTIGLCIYELHRNKLYWEDPNQFKPERFVNNKHIGHFFPFGGGSRMCIGSGFALIEMISVIRYYLSNYSVFVKGDLNEIKHELILKPPLNATINFISKK
jgi:cytochrome P450